jgi:hypothetical protein
MGKSAYASFILVAIIVLLPSVFAEITVITGDAAPIPSSPDHKFLINKYYTSYMPGQPAGKEIIIEPLVTEASVEDCENANFSFRLSNQGTRDASYAFSVEKFTGTAYISPNVIIPAKESRIILFSLSPCGTSGDINPMLRIETDNEIASLPILIHVQEVPMKDEGECSFYYPEDICTSPYYIRFYQDRKYSLDLSNWFYDPDQEMLSYQAESAELDVRIKEDIAELTPRRGFSGASEVVFTARDEAGGSVSKSFYFHILKAEQGTQTPWLLIIGVAAIILLLLVILLVVWSIKNQ